MTVPEKGGGGFRVSENPNLQNLARQNLCHFSKKLSEPIMWGWQKLLMRNSGRLLLFPGELSWCINQHSCLHPFECRRNTTNEERPIQHFCDFQGNLIIINQIIWHTTREQRHSLTYTSANICKHGTNCAQTFRTEFVTHKVYPA